MPTLTHAAQVLQPAPLRTDAEILDWLQRQHTLHRAVHAYYAVGSYVVQITHDDFPIPNAEWQGETLRQAYSIAMAHWDLTHGARDLLAERTITLPAPTPLDYNQPGHICPQTGRLCMTLADAYAREDMPDRHFSLYVQSAADLDLDPWKGIDGLDASTALGPDGRPEWYEIDYANGRSQRAQATLPVYMQRTKAERESGTTGILTA